MPYSPHRPSSRPRRAPRSSSARPVRRISTTPPREDADASLSPQAPLDLRIDERKLQRASARRRKRRVDIMMAVAATLLVGIIAVTLLPNRDVDETTVSGTVATAAEAEDRDPTPVFATYRSMPIRLPVPTESLTEIAFHQAAGSNALSISTNLPDADMDLAAAEHGTPKSTTADSSVVLDAQVLRMWRSGRSGQPDTAVDVGAAPGTIVYAPVSGEVLAVREYWLYGEYEDYEVHIQPDGWPEVDCILIHIDAVRVEEGDRVTAGVTPVAEIRLLSDRIDHQIAGYTTDGGDHVHIQLNRMAVPGKLEGIGES